MSRLHPSLETIEDRLFGPSDTLIDRWLAGDASLSDEQVRVLEEDPLALARRGTPRELGDAEREASLTPAGEDAFVLDKPVPLCQRMREAIGSHVALMERFPATASASVEAAAGQIRLIERAIGPDAADLGVDLREPLAVMLWRPAEQAGLWSGWLMSEDTDYATYWDVLLEDVDAPYDPVASMVQLWNPVQVPPASLGQWVGQLSPERIDALASAFLDFVTNEPEPDKTTARPGAFIERLTRDGARIMTGTVLGDAEIERRGYQALYFEASALLRDLAKAYVAATVENSQTSQVRAGSMSAALDGLVENLRRLCDSVGLVFEPGLPAAVMGSEAPRKMDDTQSAEVVARRIAGLVKVELIPLEQESVLVLRFSEAAVHPLTIRLLLQGDALESIDLVATGDRADLTIEPEAGLVLAIERPGAEPLQWDLSVDDVAGHDGL